MIYIIILLILFLIWYFFIRNNSPVSEDAATDYSNHSTSVKKDLPIAEPKIYIDEDGQEYILKITEIQIPRKTYIRGYITGKYRGELMLENIVLHNTKHFEFEIYEAEVNCLETSRDIAFSAEGDIFPKERLPQTLPVSLQSVDKVYSLNILEPALYSFTPNKKLHQTDGNEVFGCFTGEITGYILDYLSETFEEHVPIGKVSDDVPITAREPLIRSNVPTGRVERKPPYIKEEFFATNMKDTLWGPWRIEKHNTPVSTTGGCFTSVLGLLGIGLGLIFLAFLLPHIGYILIFFAILLLFQFFGSILKWILRGAALILLILFGFSVFNNVRNGNTEKSVTTPRIVDKPSENNDFAPIVENYEPQQSEATDLAVDSIFKRHRIWEDYNGTTYEGTYFIRLSDYRSANYHKNNMQLYKTSVEAYDEIVFNLKEHDKSRMEGLYKLFDSIQRSNELSKVEFAEMIGSFVQDIPYSLILDNECNARLYNDVFTTNYLSSKDARCMGHQRFGLNSPVEFMANLYGDCDTRTLLLYTIFSYYGYDVAMMSSEFYGHSIIGINLPIPGLAYQYNNQRYVLWETTVPHLRPGMISNEISNLNNWRISLKSK